MSYKNEINFYLEKKLPFYLEVEQEITGVEQETALTQSKSYNETITLRSKKDDSVTRLSFNNKISEGWVWIDEHEGVDGRFDQNDREYILESQAKITSSNGFDDTEYFTKSINLSHRDRSIPLNSESDRGNMPDEIIDFMQSLRTQAYNCAEQENSPSVRFYRSGNLPNQSIEFLVGMPQEIIEIFADEIEVNNHKLNSERLIELHSALNNTSMPGELIRMIGRLSSESQYNVVYFANKKDKFDVDKFIQNSINRDKNLESKKESELEYAM